MILAPAKIGAGTFFRLRRSAAYNTTSLPRPQPSQFRHAVACVTLMRVEKAEFGEATRNAFEPMGTCVRSKPRKSCRGTRLDFPVMDWLGIARFTHSVG
jgi:hypothetical protein